MATVKRSKASHPRKNKHDALWIGVVLLAAIMLAMVLLFVAYLSFKDSDLFNQQ